MEVEVKHADVYVDSNSPQNTQDGSVENPYHSITAGSSHALAGQTIFVAPASYSSNESFPIFIDTNGIVIEGAGYENTIVYGDHSNAVFVVTASNVIISDLTVTNAQYTVEPYFGAIVIDGDGSNQGKATIKNCRIAENSSPGVCFFHSLSDSSVENCLIENNNVCGIFCEYAHNTTYFRNCTILNNGNAGIAPEYDSFVFISDCIIMHHSEAGVRAVFGSDTWLYNSTFWNNPYIYLDDGTCSLTYGIYYEEDVPFESDGIRNYYLNQGSICVDHGMAQCSGSDEICHQTTKADNEPFPSGLYDIDEIDIGFHYHPRCFTPTPVSTPSISTPIPCSTYTPDAGFVIFGCDYYETEDMRASIEIIDNDLNTDPYTFETVEVTVSNSAKASIPFTLREESTNSGLFTSASNNQDLEFTLSSSVDYEAIQVIDLDTVTVTYLDETYMEDRTDTATWYQFGMPTRTSTPTPTGTWFTSTPTSTETPTPTPTGTWSTNTPVPTGIPTDTPGGPTETPTATHTVTATPGPWTETDSWGNTGTTLTSFSWIDATSGTDLNITEDNGFAAVSLPFNFDFYGNTYNSVNVSANGYLTFGSDAQEFENDYMPRDTEPNNVIAPFFDDLDPSDSGHVYYLDSGTSVTFEWDLFRNYWSWTDSYTFEVTLYNDGEIKFQYYVMSGIFADGYSATVGIENTAGTIGLRYRDTYASGIISDSMAILFTPPSATPIPTATPGTLQQVMNETVENDGAGWSATGLWHVVDTGSGNPCAKAHDGTKSFWYGLDETCNYDTGTWNSGELISPPLLLAENITFNFWSWEEVGPHSFFGFGDNRIVYISEDDGQTWDLVFLHESNTTDWEQHSIDIEAWAYKTVRIKFVFDTIDEFENDYPGWYIDDIMIESSVPPSIPAMGIFGSLAVLALISLTILFGRKK
ncbi:right-handed parallel beta-helix repeat-containing protein [bacterium]|nr:right-handed parallel beta-helix repeat-containing protein [bacterium]